MLEARVTVTDGCSAFDRTPRAGRAARAAGCFLVDWNLLIGWGFLYRIEMPFEAEINKLPTSNTLRRFQACGQRSCSAALRRSSSSFCCRIAITACATSTATKLQSHTFHSWQPCRESATHTRWHARVPERASPPRLLARRSPRPVAHRNYTPKRAGVSPPVRKSRHVHARACTLLTARISLSVFRRLRCSGTPSSSRRSVFFM